MQPTMSVSECPHCGGKAGFSTTIAFTAKRFTTWEGDCIDTDGYEVRREGDPRCMDCERPVRALFRVHKSSDPTRAP